MQIRLKDVRQHKDRSFDFPAKGLIYLSGRSGRGKTTVFDAIEDALYDTGSDMQPWTGGSPLIELTIEELDLKIIKKRNPGSLTVIHNNTTYIEAEAQSLIIRLIGMTAEEFNACSYIRQEGAGSLLSLTPADQLRFIQKLACNGFDPDLFKGTLNLHVNGLNNTLNTLKGELQQTITNINTHQTYTNDEPIAPTRPHKAPDDAHRRWVCDSLDALDEEKVKLTKDLQSDKLSLLESAKLQAEFDRNSIDNKKLELNEHLKHPLKRVDTQEKDRLLAEQAILGEASRYWEQYAKAQAKSESLRINYRIPKNEKVSTWLGLEKAEIQKELSASTAKADALNKEIDELTKSTTPHGCPWCEQPLSISTNKIVKGVPNQDKISDQIDEKSKELTNLRYNIARCNDLLEIYTKSINELNLLLSMLPKRPTLTAAEVSAKVTENMTSMQAHQKAVAAQDQYDQQTVILTTALQRLEQAFKATMASIRALSLEPIRSRQELTAALSEVQDKAIRLTQQLKEQDALTVEWKHYHANLSNYQKLKKVFDDSIEIVHTNRQKQEILSKEIDKINTEMVAGDRLIELTNIAATSAIEGVLEEINSNSTYFLDKAFAEDGTSIVLTNTFKTQKGEERAKIGVEIFHKGQKAKRLSSFSGGEKARARLAFQLGLAKLFKSPVLLVDEATHGLDEENKNICLQMLKECSAERLVIVIEHGVEESLFDEIFEI